MSRKNYPKIHKMGTSSSLSRSFYLRNGLSLAIKRPLIS
jgi:hypothetical protein